MMQSYVGKTWGFPRGKINKNESEMDCAAREVYEETGYQCREKVIEKDSLKFMKGNKRELLYIIQGVDENYKFQPNVRKEVGILGWHPIASLLRKRGSEYRTCQRVIRKLKKWIDNIKKGEITESEGEQTSFSESDNAYSEYYSEAEVPSEGEELSQGRKGGVRRNKYGQPIREQDAPLEKPKPTEVLKEEFDFTF